MAVRFGSSSRVKARLPRYSNFWDGTAVYAPWNNVGSYDALATYTVGAGGVSSVTFSGISSDYTHLQIRILAATDRATYAIDNMFVTLNGDTGSNYSFHSLEGNGSSASSGSAANNTDVRTGTLSSSAASNVFTASIVDILDYANTNKYKTTRSLSGFDVNGTVSGYGGFIQLYSSSWRSTNPVTSITFNRQTGSNFLQYSQFAIYGVK